MSRKKICIHHLDEPIIRSLEDYEIIAETFDRESLRTALGIEHVEALIIDLDHADALDAIVESLEIKSGLAVVGVTGTNDVNKCITAQRAGCSQLTSKPIDENDLLVAIRRALDEISEPPPLGKTICVIGTSGGSGTTTLACYLAMAISELSPSVGIIDADFELGTVAQAWDLNPRYTTFDLINNTSINQQDVEDVMLELPSGISVLPRPNRLDQANAIQEVAMKSILEATMAAFPFVVIDLPRKLDPLTGCAIEACDKLLIVTQLTVPGIINTGRMAEALYRWEVPTDKIEYVVNRYNGKFHSVEVATLEEKIGKKVLGVVPNHYKSLSAAADLGQPVSQGNPVRKAISDIAVILCGGRNRPTLASPSWISNLGFGR